MVFSGYYTFSQNVLTINVTNIKKKVGEIQVSAFNNKESFLKENEEYKIYRFKVTSLSERFDIQDLPKGDYAFIIYHDLNNNKEIDKNIYGIPMEPYGFSQNVKPRYSAPYFEDCSISLEGSKNIKISLL